MRRRSLFLFPGALDSPLIYSNLPRCLLFSHLPFNFLCNLLNSQFVVLRQELQLFVNKSQPLLPLLTHVQAVNPENKHAGYKTQIPTQLGGGSRGASRKPTWAAAVVQPQRALAVSPAHPGMCSLPSRARGRARAATHSLSGPLFGRCGGDSAGGVATGARTSSDNYHGKNAQP